MHTAVGDEAHERYALVEAGMRLFGGAADEAGEGLGEGLDDLILGGAPTVLGDGAHDFLAGCRVAASSSVK